MLYEQEKPEQQPYGNVRQHQPNNIAPDYFLGFCCANGNGALNRANERHEQELSTGVLFSRPELGLVWLVIVLVLPNLGSSIKKNPFHGFDRHRVLLARIAQELSPACRPFLEWVMDVRACAGE